MPARLLCLLGLLFAFASAQWTQDRFAISFWVDPIVPPSDFPARYAEIREANFTVVLGGFGATTNDTIVAQLNACQENGLVGIVDTGGLAPNQLFTSPACWGYRLYDEPSAPLFPQLASTSFGIRSARPDMMTFINLLPTYASSAQLGTATYEEYVSEYMATVKPQVLCVDHYPYMQPGSDTRDAYCANLAILRTFALAAGIPFWNFFNSMPFNNLIDPSEAQLRWQIMTSVAYGAKGVLYFCYWTPTGSPFLRGGAIMTPQGASQEYVPGPHYYQAQRINSVLVAWGPTLMRCNSTAVYRVAPGSNPSQILAGALISNLVPDLPGEGDYLLGQYTCLNHGGRVVPAILLNNYDYSFTAWPGVTFSQPVLEVDPSTGMPVAIVDDSPLMPGTQLEIQPGAGRLFIAQ